MTDTEPEPVAVAFQEILYSDVFPFFPEKRWAFLQISLRLFEIFGRFRFQNASVACQHPVFAVQIQKHWIFRLKIEIGCAHIGCQNQCAMQIFHREHQSLPAFWIFCIGNPGFQIRV